MIYTLLPALLIFGLFCFWYRKIDERPLKILPYSGVFLLCWLLGGLAGVVLMRLFPELRMPPMSYLAAALGTTFWCAFVGVVKDMAKPRK